MIRFIFKNLDTGITMTNRERAEANIWKTVDDEDTTIIATHLVEMAKGSKIVATAVRRMTNSFRIVQINMVMFPKFLQTFQFYQAHGGFSVMPNLTRRPRQ